MHTCEDLLKGTVPKAYLPSSTSRPRGFKQPGTQTRQKKKKKGGGGSPAGKQTEATRKNSTRTARETYAKRTKNEAWLK